MATWSRVSMFTELKILTDFTSAQSKWRTLWQCISNTFKQFTNHLVLMLLFLGHLVSIIRNSILLKHRGTNSLITNQNNYCWPAMFTQTRLSCQREKKTPAEDKSWKNTLCCFKHNVLICALTKYVHHKIYNSWEKYISNLSSHTMSL